MNKLNIIAVALVALLATNTTWARPAHGARHRPTPARHHVAPRHHHHTRSVWGRGGRNFLPGFIGGVVGGALVGSTTRTIVTTPAPVVVTPTPVIVTTPTPVYTTQNVWIEGRYIDQVQANGSVVRVWQPGHYEQQQILVQ